MTEIDHVGCSASELPSYVGGYVSGRQQMPGACAVTLPLPAPVAHCLRLALVSPLLMQDARQAGGAKEWMLLTLQPSTNNC